MKPDTFAGTYGWEQIEGHPLREQLRARVALLRAVRPGAPPAPHYFVSPASGRTGCDVCGQPSAGHAAPC